MNVSARHWVYRLFDGDDRLLYIGMTGNPAQRLAGWSSRGTLPRYRWWADVVRIDWQQYEGRIAASTAEREAIRAEHPRHNVMLRVAA